MDLFINISFGIVAFGFFCLFLALIWTAFFIKDNSANSMEYFDILNKVKHAK